MIYLDTNVVMYAVGRAHPLRDEARARLADAPTALFTSSEVLQELLHAYLPVGRDLELDAAFDLVSGLTTILDVTAEDVQGARDLAATTPSLTARDLVHLSIGLRHGVSDLWTYDRALAAAFAARRGS
jgi:predicted nucleic acid-binding protein